MSIRQLYLLTYNAGMLLEWGLVGVRILRHLSAGGAPTGIFPLVRDRVRRLLFVSCLEIIHAATGIVKAPVGPTLVQCLVRLASFAGAMDLGSAAVERSSWCAQTLCAWTVSEVVRYAFYARGVLPGGPPKWLTWLRYSAFVALYPIGISGEMGCFATVRPHVRANGILTLAMPNRWNMGFDYASVITALLLFAYPPGAYKLYTYMLAQRRKVLAKPQ
jgi:very-long-chain (3R)-3-hydroxyacyl-CoA dehydratase